MISKKIVREVERLKASSDSGEVFTVIVTQEFIVIRGGDDEIPHLKTAKTIDGDELNFKNENQFELPDGGVLTRI